jgi:DNA-binding transcriptional LysR family regulator
MGFVAMVQAEALRPHLLKPARPLPAAAGLSPAVLLALQAFEVVIRLGSFKAAATALHISPSAVSHRIRMLERTLGEPLFTRAHREVRPTRAGTALAATTGRAFADLLRATAPTDSKGGRRRLRLAVAPPFTSAWLLPRVASFLAAHPEIELALETVSRSVDLETEPFDAAIRIGDGTFPGLTAVHLMDIGTTPVAGEALTRRLGPLQPTDLASAPLVHVSSYPLAWPLWFNGAGLGGTVGRQAIWVDTFGAAWEAAEHGLGIALGLVPLVDGARALRRLFRFTLPTGALWFLHTGADRSQPVLRAFKRWLVSEFTQHADSEMIRPPIPR